jgi:hypothetical protein
MRTCRLSMWLLLPLFVATSCKHGDDEPAVTTINRTVLVYMMADNSLNSFSSSDITEMVTGMASVDVNTNNLLIYVDSYSAPKLIKLDKKNGSIVQTVVKTYDESVSTSESVMKSVVNDVFTTYPAESYGLVLWSHALGWTVESSATASPVISRYAGIDDTGGRNYLNISTISNVLSSAPHLSFILFDECYMSSVEALYDLRSYADYFIASAEEIPGPGANYADVVPAMFKTSDIGKAITDAYYNYYGNLYNVNEANTNSRWTAGASITLIKSSALDNLAAATKAVLPKYITNKTAIDISNLFCYDLYSNLTFKIFFDFDSFMKQITGGNNTDYTTWKAAYDACVLEYKTTATNFTAFSSNYIDMTGSTGLSIYVPTDRDLSRITSSTISRNTDFQSTAWYKAAGWSSTGW